PGPAGRAPDCRGGADHPLAAECVLDLAAARGRRGAAPVSGPGAAAAVADVRHPAPGGRRPLWGAADRVAGRGPRGRAPYPAPVQACRAQCDQAVAQDAATQAYVRQVEQDYDTMGDEAPRPPRDDDFNSEQLMHELEEFLRQEREGDAE